MRSSISADRRLHLRPDLAGLLFASVLVGALLAILYGVSSRATLSGMASGHLLVIAATLGGLGLFTVSLLAAARLSRAAARKAGEETARLRKELLTVEAIVKAEPQVLVFWEQGHGPRVVSHNLGTVAGLPQSTPELLRFGQWLEPASADALKTSLDALFADGRAFNLLLKTVAGGHLEADGRTAGGRAILKLRDVAGHKRDLARILDQHRALARDIRAYRTLLNALPIPVWMRQDDGTIDWVNKAYVKAVEASDEAEVRERQIELIESHQRREMTGALSRGQMYRKQVHLIVGGERRAHDLVALPLEDVTVAAALDIEAAESARGELDRHMAAYERTLDKVATAVAVFGPDRRLGFYNEAYLKLWQLDPAWLQTRPLDGEILDRLREVRRLPEKTNYRDWKSKVLGASRAAPQPEDWWHLPDGRVIHILAEQRPDGGVTYVYDDATERFALESRYNALIDVQRETLDNLKEGVAVFAPDGRLRLFNNAFAQVWKISRGTLKEGPHVDEIIRQCRVLHEDDNVWARVNRAVTAISDVRKPFGGQMMRPDGSVIDFTILPLPDGQTLTTFADVTATKRYERALIERNDALVAADRLKSQFVQHVSYSLRTPLTSIIGFSELLGRPFTGDLNVKQREYLNVIHGESNALLALINDILDLTTIDAGALELRLAPVRAAAIVDAAVHAVRDRLSRARLQIATYGLDDGIALVADENRLRQVLYNLLSNAIGFSEPGQTIHIGCRKEGKIVVFSVADEGRGIAKENQAKVFERFESQTQGSRHRGAGLGLSIVKSLVELHGGRVELVSEPGKGTTVTFRLPEAPMRAVTQTAPPILDELAQLDEAEHG
ncbi:MAG: ATP-binding protein [Hyphomicrobiaceae bacterium]